MKDSPEDVRKKAHTIASSGKAPRAVWTELRNWASQNGPLAMKSAVIEFISIHGTSPEAAILMPQLMNDTSLSPPERKELMSLATSTRPDLRKSTLSPKLNVPSEKLALTFRPASGSYAPGLTAPLTSDHSSIRDMPLIIRERTRIAIDRPTPAALGTSKFDSSKSPDTFVLSAPQHGEHMVRSLVEKMKSHGREEPAHPVQGISGQPMEKRSAKVSKKKAKAKPMKKAKKASAKASRSKKKPVVKKSRRK